VAVGPVDAPADLQRMPAPPAHREAAGSEGPLEAIDPIGQNRHHVEADRSGPPPSGRQPLGSRPSETTSAPFVDRLGRVSVRLRRAGLDLTERHHTVALHDQVDLAGPTAPVAGQDPVAVADVSACGHPLTPVAQGDVPGPSGTDRWSGAGLRHHAACRRR